MRAVADEARRLAGPDTARKVQAWADELVGKVDESGVIPGKAYQSFDSRLGKELKAGGEAAHYLGSLREVVRGAMDDSISAKDRAAWKAILLGVATVLLDQSQSATLKASIPSEYRRSISSEKSAGACA